MCLFVEVADRGSLTQTAGPLGRSVAMLSRDLTAIEDWFGARLLHRSTRKISLTDAGMSGWRPCASIAADLRADPVFLCFLRPYSALLWACDCMLTGS
ncbi:MAG: LysR family transcriptional regulator [Burkholderiaceae bacterium]|nr:LysR family transcriptional regulator [Burkholderiaceae bacterium]